MNGYTSHERFAVRWRVTRTRITFNLVRTPLRRPFRKRYPRPPEVLRRYREFVRLGWSLGAYREGRLVGLVLVEPRASEASVFVWELGVAPSERRQGIATALLEEVVRRAEAEGFRAVVCETQTTNVPAIDFYRSAGFLPEGINLSEYSNDDLRTGEIALFMKKRMSSWARTAGTRTRRMRRTSK